MAAFRTLIVEDHEDLRALLRSLLENKTQCVVIGEASDGLQAVQRAQELQPDLILLDLSLPKLNGMEAGRRIRKISPHSKILFLSQEPAPEIVQKRTLPWSPILDFVLEGIVDVGQPGVGTQGRLVDLRRTLHVRGFWGALISEVDA